MKTFTINDIRKWKPGYDPTKYLLPNWSGTVIDILNFKGVPFFDRLWVIMQTDLVSKKLMRLFAVWCARQVQHLMKDERSLKAPSLRTTCTDESAPKAFGEDHEISNKTEI